ncbi:hypothetical protein TNCV_2922171 [Trichonephila clavipes]|nr:hypothetical protein TNCV_2922171 [Trichonephila clavipes]
MLNSCVMQRHTSPASGIVVWGGIGYLSCTPLVRIVGSLNNQRYIYEVFESPPGGAKAYQLKRPAIYRQVANMVAKHREMWLRKALL